MCQQKVKYELEYEGEEFSFYLDILLDVRSPISFIKEKFILNDAIEKVKIGDTRYHEINEFKIKIVGKIDLNISLNGMSKNSLQLFVVNNDTMESVVLGQDILNKQ